MMRTWRNGRSVRADVWRDRGLQYGDGLFETMRVHDHRIALLDDHLRRLARGCRRLGLPVPGPDLDHELLRAAGIWPHAVVKLIITRGPGARGYRVPLPSHPSRIVQCEPLKVPPPTHAGAVRVRLCRIRITENPALAGLKTLNRLDSVLARREWRDARIAEGLMRDHRGDIVCGTMTNIFISRRGRLLAPVLDRAGVAGVMRQWVIRTARREGIDVQVGRLSMRRFIGADEIFLTNAVIGIWPVRAVTMGSRCLHPASQTIARRLQDELARFRCRAIGSMRGRS